ncbi:site-specific tyrosine recombinase XerC [Rhodanobacter sp. Si-c]|uniref:Site-specific tyrosine recombinase XerC n=1 Tax=Rhodanobacter lycopersici TaxID=3162487 RepID=A0ABV3QK43_9GAMM
MNNASKEEGLALHRFIGWCAERGLTDPREIVRPMLERYQAHLYYYRQPNGKPLTLGSQHGCLAPLKTFFQWLVREHYLLANPASELVLPRPPKRLPRSLLSVAEVEALLREAEPTTAPGLRDRTLLEVLYATGLRRMEVPTLALYDVDLGRGLLQVREGKGRRDRVVPLGDRAAAWLAKYLADGRPPLLAGDSAWLFITDYGQPLTPEYVAAKVRRYLQFAGITKPGATHLLRHACATHMLENGADIRFIQQLLGHASVATTEIYTHVSIEKLKQIHAATHPSRLRRASDTELPDVDDPDLVARL